MNSRWSVVTIQGTPGIDVTIYPRDRGEEPPPAVFEGATNSNGRLRLLLPPGYYAVVNSGGDTLPLEHREGADSNLSL